MTHIVESSELLGLNAKYKTLSGTYFSISSAESGFSKGIQMRWKVEIFNKPLPPSHEEKTLRSFLVINDIPFSVDDVTYRITHSDEKKEYFLERAEKGQ